MNLNDPVELSQLLFLVIGVVTVVTGVLTLMFAMGERTKYLWSTKLPAVDSDEFLQTISHTANASLGHGGEVKILNSGSEFMSAMTEVMRNAKNSINFTAYIWEPGKMSDEILKIMIAKAKEGVEVRILFDSIGAMKVSKNYLNQLKEAGGKIEYFRAFQIGKLTRFHRRNHRRAIVIDGRVGYTGGMAVGDKWWGGEKKQPEWRDMMFEVRGSMAHRLQGAFAELWAGTHGEIITGEKFYAPVDSVVETYCRFVDIASSPAPDTQPLPKFFWLSISAARKSLYIVSPYVVPDNHIRHAIMDCARSGVDVRFLVPNELTDAKPIRRATHYFYRNFLRSGVKVYEYQPRMMHSKFMVVDGKWSVFGSANMDIRSKRLNEENVFGVLSEDFAGKLEKIFFEDLKQAKEIVLPEWEKRGFLTRLLEWVSVLFVEQY